MTKPFRMRDLDPETQARLQAEFRAYRAMVKVAFETFEPKFPPEVNADLRKDLVVGSWELMADVMAAVIVRRAIPLTPTERDALVTMLEGTGPNPGVHYDFLGDPKGVLAAVTMVAEDGSVVPPWPGFDSWAWRPRLRALTLWGHKGGHLHGVGIPFKTSFPPSWDAERIVEMMVDVGRNPDERPVQDRSGGWITRGVRDGVYMESRLRPDGTVANAYPLRGPGLHRNDAAGVPVPVDPADPLRDVTVLPDRDRVADRARLVDLHGRCVALVDALGPRLPGVDRERVGTGLAAGEWLIVLDDLCAALVQDAIPVTVGEHGDLAAAIAVGGLGDDDLPVLRDPDAALAAMTITA